MKTRKELLNLTLKELNEILTTQDLKATDKESDGYRVEEWRQNDWHLLTDGVEHWRVCDIYERSVAGVHI